MSVSSTVAQLDRKAEAKRIGDLIRQMRIKQGWSQTDLGTVAKIAQGNLSLMERGKLVPSAETARRLAYAFDVSADMFVAQSKRYQPRVREIERTLFGSLIVEARIARQWTREELAHKTHLTRAQIENYEDQGHLPKDRAIVDVLADVLEIERDTLLQAWHPPKRMTDRMDGDVMECIRCHKIKPLTDFHKNSQGSSGYQPRCKQCREEVRQIKKLRREGWTHWAIGGLLVGQPAKILTPPRKAYKPHPEDYPDPVWTEFRVLPAQWFPKGRLVPLEG